jgi:hypothetical protein
VRGRDGLRGAMSQWHRDNPELTGTEADPWMIHETYRSALRQVWRESPHYCSDCGDVLMAGERDVCKRCVS